MQNPEQKGVHFLALSLLQFHKIYEQEIVRAVRLFNNYLSAEREQYLGNSLHRQGHR